MILLLLLAAVAANGFVVRYEGYRLLEVGPLKNEYETKLLLNLVDQDQRLRQVIMMEDGISKLSPVTLAISPESYDTVRQILDENNIYFVVVNSNLQAHMDQVTRENEERLAKIAATFKSDPSLFNHDAYLSYADQQAWIQDIADRSPIAGTFTLGQSYEGRDILGVAINLGVTNLPIIWIDANIHAREWITSSSTLYVIEQILTGSSADAAYLRSNFRFFIVPNLNPDGYEWSRTNERLWRKTRKPNPSSPCIGTDPNRNWDANFGGEGASSIACSDTYHGPYAFSEPETRAAADLLEVLSSSTNLFISVHSYSQLWLVPWGGTRDKPDDYDELMRVGNAVADAMKSVDGKDFVVGTPPDILYVASGGSFDWAKGSADIQYAYSPELRPANAAQGGFIIPPTNIIPSGAELFAAIATSAREAIHKRLA